MTITTQVGLIVIIPFVLVYIILYVIVNLLQ
nr:MAG TPA: hypothetical protein [Bacteriophage sp.]